MSSLYVPFDQIEPLPFSNGHSAYYLWQAFPWAKSFLTSDLEQKYDPVVASNFVKSMPYLPLYFIVVYLIGIFGGQYLMKDKKPFDLRTTLAYWNLSLAIFSFIGVCRTVPTLLYFMANMTYKEVNCTPYWVTHGGAEVGFWSALFAVSKFVELFDTAFIVLRKRPLLFLHWYHHVTVLCFTYYACYFEHAGFFFVGMNYTVHSLMYFYYFLMAKKSVPKWFRPQWITFLQISQMVVGVVTGLSSYYYKFHGDKDCPGASRDLIIAGFVMYSSYLYLFVEFAINRFFGKAKAKKQIKEENASIKKSQ